MKTFIPLFILLLLLTSFLFFACQDVDDSGDDDDTVENDDDDDATDDDDDATDDDDEVTDDDDDDNAQCWDDMAPGEKVIFANGFSGTEGIAINNAGQMFVSAGDSIVLIDSTGSWDVVATGFINAVGIAFEKTGELFVCEFGNSSLATQIDGEIYRMSPSYALTQVATGIANPNFLTYTPKQTFLISDASTDEIFEITSQGALTTWSPVESPNGMVYSPGRDALYVAGTFAAGGPVYKADLDIQGDPVSWETIALIGNLSLPDGIAIDLNGMIYVTENALGKITMIDPVSTVKTEIASGMLTPASMAFGKTPNFDPCSLYVTELLGPRIWRIAIGTPGHQLVDED